MNMKRGIYNGLCICMATLMVGCSKQPPIQELDDIASFHQLTTQNTADGLFMEDGKCNVDLYIDYSTCVAEAISSSYYQAVHPAIVDCGPVFYSIKGNAIKEETQDRQTVYQLLRSIREVNNADIKKAVEQIVNNNRQAVLITDGEYYMPGITGDNLNNPYLAEYFRTWLNKGHDIYIYSEPYVESKQFNKFRYYMIFTDHRIDNNIQQRFNRSAPKDERVKMFHLSNVAPTVAYDKEYPNVNACLSLNGESAKRYPGFEVQEYQTEWNDIYKYVLEQAVDNMGNPLPKGDYVMRGLFLNNNENDAYQVKEVAAVTYNIYPSYQELLDSIATNGKTPACELGRPIERVFVVDNDILQKTGEIVLRLDPEFDGSTLSAITPNLLRVDLVVKSSKENFTENADINQNFRWRSISARNDGKDNTSLYESIRQVLIDPSVSPEKKNSNLIYTLYLNTFSM